MNINLINDEKNKQIEIDIKYPKLYEAKANEIKSVLEYNFGLDRILCYKGLEANWIKTKDIITFYSQNQKVFARTNRDTYDLKFRLYQLELKLPQNQFVRISNSEIINLDKIDTFDFTYTGKITVKLCDGTTTMVSRRCIKKIKDIIMN